MFWQLLSGHNNRNTAAHLLPSGHLPGGLQLFAEPQNHSVICISHMQIANCEHLTPMPLMQKLSDLILII